ncbi:glycosylhydrolase-like jelly roll fold domain-containing protein [Halalkalibacter hemicellulosilyticus]|uniref:Possible DNA-binding protein n=1 Tax=Halalkalibacter hemicellulosilyticusJCM 9152 TaxID=1236971 RepID=W4QJN3_9BACI|nr:glycosylhydrolase-like jelly roll fold domain-containing protein [Halalkalibacter hemicellulosilyticus]GAE31544.1 possible DNA-binding protein [Halalkalibacter hemicellulosilyticusJCM 9152]
MSNRLLDVLRGEEENYILPFFWQHGEEEEVLREEMARIHESKIRAVCVEARPHPDFLGPKWWRDMDIIMEEARKRDMRVWILDDDHFPTGHAAGKLKGAPKELRRLFLSTNYIDALGPRLHSSFIVEPSPYIPGYFETGGGKIIAVIAIKRDEVTGELTNISKDLTSKVENGKLYWDVPKGYWRIFTIIENERGGDLKKNDYLNPLVRKSVKVLLDTVHEAFYDRYRNDFGKTIAGFFSDEPGFYNEDSKSMDTKLGKSDVSLPWSNEMYQLMEEEYGSNYKLFLPLLWHDGTEMTHRIRYCYMNLVSKLYAENFTQQVGDWCREHGVEYIGHILEDNNVHARLGCGAGHFFRALGGQDMSGLDVVLWQLNPGFDDIPSKAFHGEADNEFYHYGIAKMASSLAHLDPKKQRRTMAEIFGAYGWVEGLKLMKWMTDHMLVRGVNYFVPHAFSPKEYPDHDCPPHMYARGKNPQFRYYRYLNEYTNRVSHLLSSGRHVASAAVLYHGEAEWSGECMFFQKPVKELMRNQIDCDILPCDAIIAGVEVENTKLISHDETFDCLIIPYSEALPMDALKSFVDLAKQDLPIYFIDGLPKRSSEGERIDDIVMFLDDRENVKVIGLDVLAQTMKAAGYYDIRVSGEAPHLRCYHSKQKEVDVYMFFNEHPIESIDTEVELPVHGTILFYDAYENIVWDAQQIEKESISLVSLKLVPFETIFIVVDNSSELQELELSSTVKQLQTSLTIEGSWSLSTATSMQYPTFTTRGELKSLLDLSRVEGLQSFSGTMRYKKEINWVHEDARIWIDLGDVFEIAEVFVNGESVGVRLQAPYQFEMSNYLREGINTIQVEVTNTLVKENNDMLSRIGHHEPSGLIGPVRILKEK